MKKEIIVKLLSHVVPTVGAEAHCDIPCGIYDPIQAKIAAKTIQRMVMQLSELKPPQDWNNEHERLAYVNAVSRRIAIKEEHGRICKQELQILWSDFFKPEHLATFPDLHDKFWKALKLCSKNKQEADDASAKELVDAVDEIAKMFYEAKSAPDKYDAYKKITDTVF